MSLSVALDTSALLPDFKEHATRGIGRYVRELSSYFAKSESREVRIFNFNQVDLVRKGFVGRMIESLPLGKRTISQQLFYPFRLATGMPEHCDIVHFPAHMDAPAWNPRRYIVTVLDLIPLVLADMYKAEQPSLRFHLARWLEIRAIQNASLVIAISHNTARDVEKLLGVPADRIAVTHLGIDQKFFVSNNAKAAKKQFKQSHGVMEDVPLLLYVGGIDQRKNIDVLLRVVKEVNNKRREAGAKGAKLLMVGRIDQDRQYPKLLESVKSHGMQDDLILSGYLDDLQLMQAYAASDVFLYPSLYEGFGFPPLEAMAAGIPVVCSNTSCMPEVLGTSALMFDPTDIKAMSEATCAVLEKPDLSCSLIDNGLKQASKFTWEQTGAATLKAYSRFQS